MNKTGWILLGAAALSLAALWVRDREEEEIVPEVPQPVVVAAPEPAPEPAPVAAPVDDRWVPRDYEAPADDPWEPEEEQVDLALDASLELFLGCNGDPEGATVVRGGEWAPEDARVCYAGEADALEVDSRVTSRPVLDVRITNWPEGAKIWAWSMPYSRGPDCGGDTISYDEAAAVIVGEVTRAEQRIEVEGYVGKLHGVVVAEDEEEALARVKAHVRGPVSGSPVVTLEGLLYSVEGPSQVCDCGC